MEGRYPKRLYTAKIVRHDPNGKTHETIIGYTHAQKTIIQETDEEGNVPGIYVELCGVQEPGEPVRSEFITLPQDGDVIYYMNFRGDTIDKDVWPLRDTQQVTPQKEMRLL